MEVVGIATALISILATIVTGVFTLINRRGGHRDTRELRREPTWSEQADENRNLRQEMADQEERFDRKIEELTQKIDRIDREKRTREWAMSHVMREAASQWPYDLPDPVFTPTYTDPILDLMPYRWRPKAS